MTINSGASQRFTFEEVLGHPLFHLGWSSYKDSQPPNEWARLDANLALHIVGRQCAALAASLQTDDPAVALAAFGKHRLSV